MHFFALTFDKVIVRFYLMMACVLIGEFSGQHSISLLALPIFLSALMGIRVNALSKSKPITKIIELPHPHSTAADLVA